MNHAMKRMILFTVSIALIFASGCIGTEISYNPKEQMVMASSHNNLLWIGPCGSPWNKYDQINILLPDKSVKCDSSSIGGVSKRQTQN